MHHQVSALQKYVQFKFLYLSPGNAREPPYLDRSSHERVEDKLLQSLSNESIAQPKTSKAEKLSQRLPSSVGSNRAFQHDAWNLYPSPQIGGVDDYQVGGGFCSEEDEEEQVLAMWAKNQRTEKTLNMTGLFNLSQVTLWGFFAFRWFLGIEILIASTPRSMSTNHLLAD